MEWNAWYSVGFTEWFRVDEFPFAKHSVDGT